MSRHISNIIVALFLFSPLALAKEAPKLKSDLKTLFSHGHHESAMAKTGISCSDCHSFSVKSLRTDPLAPPVGSGFTTANPTSCHKCHLGTVNVARPNQCTLCHADSERLKPNDHLVNWQKRHGWFAQQNIQSCSKCHTDVDKSCSKCHGQRDTVRPALHPPNFRISHSIKARANPQSCTVCHTSPQMCTDCHQGIKR